MNQTRSRILEIARELFAAYGSDAISNAALAEALGIAVGNLWYHFRTREDLMRALAGKSQAEFEIALSDAGGSAPAALRLRNFVTRTLDVIWRYSFLITGTRDGSAARAEAQELARRQYAALEALLCEMQSAGDLVANAPKAPQLASILWILGRYWVEFSREAPHGSASIRSPADCWVLQRTALAPWVTDNAAKLLAAV